MRRLLVICFSIFAIGACNDTWVVGDDQASVTAFSFSVKSGDAGGDGECGPTLATHSDCSVPCEMLIVFPASTDQSAGCTTPGTHQPSELVISYFRQQYVAALGDAVTAAVPVVCVYDQLVGGSASTLAQATQCTNDHPDYDGATCVGAAASGWCYVMPSTNGCSSEIAFGATGPPPETTLWMNCVE